MELSRKFEGKKFMWDGNEYTDEKEAKETMKKYEDDGFEVRLVKEEGKFYLFTRREVKEIIVEG